MVDSAVMGDIGGLASDGLREGDVDYGVCGCDEDGVWKKDMSTMNEWERVRCGGGGEDGNEVDCLWHCFLTTDSFVSNWSGD